MIRINCDGFMSKDVKFARLVGVRREQGGELMELPFSDNIQNHIGNMHASAQFALAEISSGDFMRRRFSGLEGKVLAVVRNAEIKYSKPVRGALKAHAEIDDEDESRFLQQLEASGRAKLAVQVRLVSENGEAATTAVYHWFVTKL
ncbi:MAG TPA: DUF4442 domain-containing protein [Gammaproteobacteria bacterium]|nr:DUF4442 domain-containing protein [Gammaproteobacteria bacterium]